MSDWSLEVETLVLHLSFLLHALALQSLELLRMQHLFLFKIYPFALLTIPIAILALNCGNGNLLSILVFALLLDERGVLVVAIDAPCIAFHLYLQFNNAK